jgi:hypothetical protein
VQPIQNGRRERSVEKGLIMGKRGLPKKPLTVQSDLGRIDRHITPFSVPGACVTSRLST